MCCAFYGSNLIIMMIVMMLMMKIEMVRADHDGNDDGYVDKHCGVGGRA